MDPTLPVCPFCSVVGGGHAADCGERVRPGAFIFGQRRACIATHAKTRSTVGGYGDTDDEARADAIARVERIYPDVKGLWELRVREAL